MRIGLENMQRAMTARCAVPVRALGTWYVLHTKSRQERILADTLQTMGIGSYLPLARQIRYYGTHKIAVDLPLFVGYVFMRGSLEDAYIADRTKRVAKIIHVNDQQKLDTELTNIQLALDQGAELDLCPCLTRGTHVEVRSGPLRGLRGVVEDRIKPNRLVLQVEMLGRAVSLEVDGALLDRLY